MASTQRQLQPVVMKGMQLIIRNFRGQPSPFNREGVRNFGVLLPPDIAEAMQADGWNVKYLKPSEEEREEGHENGPAWLPVEASFDKGKPPKITLITSRGMTVLTEDMVEQLDHADVAVDPDTGLPKCDLIVRPFHWTNEATGRSGVKAYLKTMFVTIEEDELERKYADLDVQ